MAQTTEERQASNVDALTAPEQATPGASVLRCPPLVLDSGATIHVFSDAQFLRNIRYLRSPMEIRVADGRPVYAHTVGDLYTEDIKLKNVYVVPDLKANLVSVHELAKAGISTTFYEDIALLRKGENVVGHAIVVAGKSLYQLISLSATRDDAHASDTSSGSEPGMVAAVDGSNLTEEVVHLMVPIRHFKSSQMTQDDLAVFYRWAKSDLEEYTEKRDLMRSLDDTAVYSALLKREYIQYPSQVSKFYQSDKTGGGVCCNKSCSVRVKAHTGPYPDGMHEADFIKSLKD